jgi:competence protein ComEC
MSAGPGPRAANSDHLARGRAAGRLGRRALAPRPVLPLATAAYVAGVLAADAELIGTTTARAVAVLCVAAGLWLGRLGALRAPLALVALLVVGVMRGGAGPTQLAMGPSGMEGETTVEAVVCGRERGARSLRVRLCDARAIAEAPHDGNVPPRGLLLGAQPDSPESAALSALRPGQSLRARLRIRTPLGVRNPGGRDDRRALARRGIGGRASLADPALVAVLVGRGREGPASLLDAASHAIESTRAQIALRLQDAGPGGGLLAALAVGRREGLSVSTRDAFVRLGLAHLLAVSGLHLALVAGAAYLAARALGGRIEIVARAHDVRGVALVVAILLAGLYALLCGFAPPVRRAWGFLLVLGIGLGLRRRLPGPNVLCLVLLAIGLREPAALFSPSLQLSFAASLALLTGAAQAERPASMVGGAVGRVAARAGSLLRASALAIGATAPVLAVHGMAGGATGLLFNLIAVPLTAVLLLPASLGAGLCAWLESAGIEGLAPCIAATERVARWAVAVAELAAVIVPAAAPNAPPIPVAVAIALLLALAVVRARQTAVRIGLVLAIGLWLAGGPAPWLAPGPPRIVVLDVGQGDALLVQGRTAAMLVDGGRALPGGLDLGRSRVAPALAALRIRRIDLLVATHADVDHRGGLVAVIERFEIGRVWLPFGGATDPDFRALRAAARRRGVPVEERGLGSARFEQGDLRVTALWPPPVIASEGGHATRVWSRNDRSLVLRAELAGRRLLLTGDIGRAAERALLDRGVDVSAEVLKVSHHGSGSSSSARFLAAVAPSLALLSAPCGGRAGLPNEAALARLRASGASLGWTGRDGALLVGLGGPGDALAVKGYGERRAGCEGPGAAPPAAPGPLVAALPLGQSVARGIREERRRGIVTERAR